ncbi:hypothetical protein HPG69_012645, partial [Diceros bicornis minor]
MSRECIRKFFPERKSFVFDRPASAGKLLLHIEEASENQMEWDFQVQSKNFCSCIFTKAKIETLGEGIIVTGN